MQQGVQGSARWRSGFKIALTALLGVVAMAITVVPASASTLAKLVFAPAPIGTVSTVAAGTTVPVTVTAEDSANNHLPGLVIFLSFQQAPGGGTAFVGTTGLTGHPQAFTTNTSGQVAITYSTPPTYPASNTTIDLIKAQNGPTRRTSTIVSGDSFSYSPITSIAFTPTPIARQGTLGPSHSMTITLTVFGTGGARLANGHVDVMFIKATGGGTASAGSVSLGKTAIQLTTDSSGQIFITYTTPAVLPASGLVDRLVGSDAPGTFGVVQGHDGYRY
jgi:hypothetical protein